MNRRKKKTFITFLIISLIILILIALLIVFRNNKDFQKLYLTINDVSIKETQVCYDLEGKVVDCNRDYYAWSDIKKELLDKNPIQKVMVDLNGHDKAVFIVLKGDITKKEDVLLIYDGLYINSDNEAYYTYNRGLEVLENLNWENAKVIRLLTEEEAKLLKCDEETVCKWLMREPDNKNGIKNYLFGYYGYGFTVYHEKQHDFDNNIYYVNAQGYLMSSGSLGEDVSSDPNHTYGLRPVIQIDSKYVILHSITNTIKLSKDNQDLEAIFVNDKLTKITLKNTYQNISDEEFEELKNELDKKEENLRELNYEADADIYIYSRNSIKNGDLDNVIDEYISIDCSLIDLEKLNELIRISSLDLNSADFISEMKTNGFN